VHGQIIMHGSRGGGSSQVDASRTISSVLSFRDMLEKQLNEEQERKAQAATRLHAGRALKMERARASLADQRMQLVSDAAGSAGAVAPAAAAPVGGQQPSAAGAVAAADDYLAPAAVAGQTAAAYTVGVHAISSLLEQTRLQDAADRGAVEGAGERGAVEGASPPKKKQHIA
jgi:hypothetical protein